VADRPCGQKFYFVIMELASGEVIEIINVNLTTTRFYRYSVEYLLKFVRKVKFKISCSL